MFKATILKFAAILISLLIPYPIVVIFGENSFTIILWLLFAFVIAVLINIKFFGYRQ